MTIDLRWWSANASVVRQVWWRSGGDQDWGLLPAMILSLAVVPLELALWGIEPSFLPVAWMDRVSPMALWAGFGALFGSNLGLCLHLLLRRVPRASLPGVWARLGLSFVLAVPLFGLWTLRGLVSRCRARLPGAGDGRIVLAPPRSARARAFATAVAVGRRVLTGIEGSALWVLWYVASNVLFLWLAPLWFARRFLLENVSGSWCLAVVALFHLGVLLGLRPWWPLELSRAGMARGRWKLDRWVPWLALLPSPVPLLVSFAALSLANSGDDRLLNQRLRAAGSSAAAEDEVGRRRVSFFRIRAFCLFWEALGLAWWVGALGPGFSFERWFLVVLVAGAVAGSATIALAAALRGRRYAEREAWTTAARSRRALLLAVGTHSVWLFGTAVGWSMAIHRTFAGALLCVGSLLLLVLVGLGISVAPAVWHSRSNAKLADLLLWTLLLPPMAFLGASLLGPPALVRSGERLLLALVLVVPLAGALASAVHWRWLIRPLPALGWLAGRIPSRQLLGFYLLGASAFVPLGGLFLERWHALSQGTWDDIGHRWWSEAEGSYGAE